jgi:hypothetical protein
VSTHPVPVSLPRGGVRAGGSSVAFMLLSSQGVAMLNCSAALAEAACDGASRQAALADPIRRGIVTPTSLERLAHVLQTDVFSLRWAYAPCCRLGPTSGRRPPQRSSEVSHGSPSGCMAEGVAGGRRAGEAGAT